MAEGVDVSEHQGDIPADWFGEWDFVIIRAFNENGIRDQWINANWSKAAGRTKRGVYGWPIPGANNYALGQELVHAFPDAEAGYWADREISGRGLAGADEVESYIRGVRDAGGAVGSFYSNIGECAFNDYLDGQIWWMADYTYNNGERQDPYLMPPIPQRAYTIHQYSSAGGLDRNWSENMDWTGAPQPEPLPKPREEDMYIVENRDDPAAMTLYTALGATDHIDKGFRDVLVFCGVPVFTLPAQQFNDVSIIHAGHHINLVNEIANKVGAGGTDITTVPDDAFITEYNRRVTAGAISPKVVVTDT